MSTYSGRLFSAADAEKVLGIPAGTVHSWHSRNRILPAGLDSCGNPMFREEELLRLRAKAPARR